MIRQIVYGFICCAFIAIGIFIGGYKTTKEVVKLEQELSYYKNFKDSIESRNTLPELTKDNVIAYICKKEIQHPLIVFAQAMYETGWLKCTGCSLDYNNLFGLKPSKNYIKFNHWTESVDFYKEWQDKHYKSGDYYEFLRCMWKRSDGSCQSYAEDPNYINKLKSIER